MRGRGSRREGRGQARAGSAALGPRGVSGIAAAALAALVAAGPIAPACAYAADEVVFEKPAVLHTEDIAPAALIEGPGWHVEGIAPTDGFLARFTIRSDAGLFAARGAETLALRVGEIEALGALAAAAAQPAWARAVTAAAARPADSEVVLRPAEPGLPRASAAGLGRFFDPLATPPAPPPVPPSERAVAAALGYEPALRAVARRLRVDPDTTNPALARRLADLAWLATVADERLGTLVAAREGAWAIFGRAELRDRVYDLSRDALIHDDAKRLRAIGATDEQIARFQSAPAFPLSLRAALVDALGRLEKASGRPAVLDLAATLVTHDQALFLARALEILADRDEQADIVELRVSGTVVARQEDGPLVVPLPVDYLSWTAPVAAFAKRADLAAPQRGFWISGRASPRAREQLEALGWDVHDGVQP
jgi:hypothetical protein